MNTDDLLDFPDESTEPTRSPRSADQWWQLLNYHKNTLRWMVVEFHPIYHNARDLSITAPRAEKRRRDVCKDIVDETMTDPLAQFDQLCHDKDPQIVSLLNQVWLGIPESTEAWTIPGFGVLCDLCSEDWCLEPEVRDQENCEDHEP